MEKIYLTFSSPAEQIKIMYHDIYISFGKVTKLYDVTIHSYICKGY